MISMGIGAAVLAATVVLFRLCLPRDGHLARFVATEWEPYVAVTFTTTAILGIGFIIVGLGELFAIV